MSMSNYVSSIGDVLVSTLTVTSQKRRHIIRSIKEKSIGISVKNVASTFLTGVLGLQYSYGR